MDFVAGGVCAAIAIADSMSPDRWGMLGALLLGLTAALFFSGVPARVRRRHLG